VTREHRGIGFVTYSRPESVDRVMAEVHQLGGTTVAVDRATPKDEGPGGKGGQGGGGGRGRGSHGGGGGRGYGGAVAVNGRGYGGAMGFNGVTQAAFHGGGGGGYGGYGVGAPGGPFNGCVCLSPLCLRVCGSSSCLVSLRTLVLAREFAVTVTVALNRMLPLPRTCSLSSLQ
jgi:hypothetical protein